MSTEDTIHTETEEESTEEQADGSQASEDYMAANPRFSRDGGTRSRFNREPPEEEPAGHASGYDDVAKSMGAEAEAVAKDLDGLETDDRSFDEMMDEAVRSAFADEVSKETEDLGPIEPITREEMRREWEGVSKEATDAARLDELEATIEDLPEKIVRVLLAYREMAEEEDEATTAELLAGIDANQQKALDDLDSLLSRIHEDEGEETAKEASGETSKAEDAGGRERVTVSKNAGGDSRLEQLAECLTPEARERYGLA